MNNIRSITFTLFICLLYTIFLEGWSLFRSDTPAYPRSQTWPSLKKLGKTNNARGQLTIMIDPAGDAKRVGRSIEDTFERSLTLQCAQEIKKTVQSSLSELRVLLTRSPGESLEPFQNASFSNRIQANLYISIHCYHSTDSALTLALYQIIHNPVTDFWQKKYTPLALYPYDQSHLRIAKKTQEYGNCMLNSLKDQEKTHKFVTQGFFGIPCRPLLGIAVPALAIEIGLSKKNDWVKFVHPLSNAIIAIVNHIQMELAHEVSLLPISVA